METLKITDYNLQIPIEITKSLSIHRNDFPENVESAFIMMKFGNHAIYEIIVNTIRETLKPYNIVSLRADDKYYHSDLFWNIITYIYFCRFGIAIFDRIETDEFNSNVSLEIGYLLALQKPLLILKDCTIKTLPTDLINRLYHEFDTRNPEVTIPPIIKKWMKNNRIGAIDENVFISDPGVKKSKNEKWPAATGLKINMLDEKIKEKLLQGKTNREVSEELGAPITRVYDIYLILKSLGHFENL